MNFWKGSKGPPPPAPQKGPFRWKSCARISYYLALVPPRIYSTISIVKKMQYNFPKSEGGLKAVWNFSENLSHLVGWPVPTSSYLLASSAMFSIYAIYSASIITTTSLPLLIVGRVLAGVCSSVNTANCSMLVAQVTPWYLWSYGCRCNRWVMYVN